MTSFKLKYLCEIYRFTGLKDKEGNIIPFELESIETSKLKKNSIYRLEYEDEKSVKYYISKDLKLNRKMAENDIEFDEKYIQKCYFEVKSQKHSKKGSKSSQSTPVKATSKTESSSTKERKKLKFEYTPAVVMGEQDDFDENNFSNLMLDSSVEMRCGNCDLFPDVSKLPCVQIVKYSLKYSDYCTFKRPNEHGTKVLANEIKKKKFDSLFQENFNVDHLKNLKPKKKLMDDDEVIINVKDGFLKFKDDQFVCSNTDPSIFIFDQSEDEKYHMEFEKKYINYSLKGNMIISNKSSTTTKFSLVDKKLKMFFNKKEYYLTEDLKFDVESSKALEIKMYDVDKILNEISKNSKLTQEQVELDAGHLIPGNFGGFIAQFKHDGKIFHLGCPQLSHVNRGIWGAIESKEKELVNKYKYLNVKKYMCDYYWICIFDYVSEDEKDVTETYLVPNWNKETYTKIEDNKVTPCSDDNLKDISQVMNFLNKKVVIDKMIGIKI